MITKEMWGVVGPDGDLVHVSECNSQCSGEFDGPALWPTREEAESVNDEYGGLEEGSRFAKVTISFS